MSTHTYTLSSFGTPLDVEWLRHLVITDTPSLAVDESEVELHMAPPDDVNNLVCIFVPTLTVPTQTDQLDAIMAAWSGRPATAPANGDFEAEDDTFFTSTYVYPSFHTCMDKTLTLDPGNYRIRFEVVVSVQSAGSSMRSKFTIDAATVGNIDFHAVQDDDHKSSYTRTTERVITSRRDINFKIEFCRASSGDATAELRDQKIVVWRVK